MKGTITVHFESDWHIGSGSSMPGAADRGLRRDHDGFPYVPAKTMVGILRDTAERLVAGADHQKVWESALLHLFGSPARPACLRLRPLRFAEPVRNWAKKNSRVLPHLTASRVGIAIDSETMAAETDKLFLTEVGRPGTALTGEFSLACADRASDDHQRAQHLLEASVAHVSSIGGSRRRGLGDCRVEVEFDTTSDDVPTVKGTRFRLVLQLETPVLVVDSVRSNIRTGLPFIPGSALLGPIIARLRGGWAAHLTAVQQGRIIVRDARPMGSSGDRSAPVPLYWTRPKRSSGGSIWTSPQRGFKGIKNSTAVRAVNPGEVEILSDSLAYTSHATIDDVRQRPTADVGGVYVNSAIPAGSVLVSELVGDTDLELPQAFDIEVGASKKDDFGSIRVAVEPVPERDAAMEAGREHVLVFVSDAIFYDDNLMPAPTIDGIEAAIQRVIPGTRVLRDGAIVRQTRRDGWSANRQPRSSAVCVAAGSVVPFLLPEDHHGPIEIRGLGERIAEGFGEVEVDPWWTRFTELRVTDGASAVRSPVEPDPAQRVDFASLPTAGILLDLVVHYSHAVAAEVSRDLGLGKSELTATQRGDLRGAFERWVTDPEALRHWIDEVSGNRKRNEIWSKTLPELERVVADGGRVVKRLRGAIGNEIFDPLWDVAPEDARRRCIAYVAVAAIRTTKGGAE